MRAERPGDAARIDAVHRAAFPTDAEARLVARLRAAGKARVALVAEADGEIVGHVLLSPVRLASGERGELPGLGLAPLAVLPASQRRGIGAALVRAALAEGRAAGAGFVVVLGDPAYYGRFGFRRAADLGLTSVYDAPDAFQVIELVPGAVPPGGGLVRHAPELDELST